MRQVIKNKPSRQDKQNTSYLSINYKNKLLIISDLLMLLQNITEHFISIFNQVFTVLTTLL